jgi:hypothetical protein
MFHGPVFQSIKNVDGWNENGIDAFISDITLQGFFKDGQTPKLILNPVLLDSLSQVCTFWVAQQVGREFQNFPTKIERIELYANCQQDLDNLTLRAQHDDMHWNVECIDNNGQPLVRIKNLENIFFEVPHAFYYCLSDPRNGWMGGPVESENENELNWYLPYLSEDFCAQSGGVFLRVIAHFILSANERQEWLGLNLKIAEKRQWLFSRMCAKEIVRYWIYEQTGELLYPSDIEVAFDENNMPYAGGWWESELIAAPQVDVQNGEGESFAVVTEFVCAEMVA